MYKCDVKIMAVKPRREMVLRLCDRLGLSEEECVVYDDRPSGGGPQYTRKKCWYEPVPEGVTHRCILQDDVDVCDNFVEIMQEIVNTHPEFIFSLFCSRMKFEYALPNSPYVIIKGGNSWGQGIMMPLKFVDPLYHFVDTELCPDFPNDDSIYTWWAQKEKMQIITTIPSTIQHLCPMQSTIGFNNKRKVSKVWVGHDCSNVNWKSKEFAISPSMPLELTLKQQQERLPAKMAKPFYTIFRKNNGNKFKEEADE